MIGTKLAHYEITSHLGSGGMGDVYQATDTKLGRSVAIKLLPDAFSHDTERVARFQREARVLASLNHSNIAAIHGLEEIGKRHFLVMELVSGETLANRIKRGAIPIEEALPIAKQIAEALEEAHEKGIIHRDLKPANIKMTPEGTVKVLDFGLAKVLQAQATADLSNSPTLLTGGSVPGLIMGTPAYMSPEQARGLNLDRRTDIWAFGCVLYEMLTGKPAFAGENVSDILSKVLQRDPDWNLLSPNVPPGIRNLLKLCLQKDVRKRRSDAADVRIDIEEALREWVTESGSLAAMAATGVSKAQSRLAWAICGLLGFGLIALALSHFKTTPIEQAIEFSVAPPAGTGFGPAGIGEGPFPAVSPDGRHVAFLAGPAGTPSRIWVRSMGSSEARFLPGTDGALVPFWSADSRSIGFFAGGKLNKVDYSGGPVQVLCDASGNPRGGTWNSEGVILFAPSPFGGIYRVSAAGSAPTRITPEAANAPTWPSFLPDGKHFLFLAQPGNTVYVSSLDSRETTRLLNADSRAIYAPPGFLMFRRQGALLAQSFDARTIQLSGEAFPIAENLREGPSGSGSFSVSESGLLIYRSSGVARRIVWFDRNGKELDPINQTGDSSGPQLSPDETRIAVQRESGQSDIWLIDLMRGTNLRLTFDPKDELDPVWSPDGSQIIYAVESDGKREIYQRPVTGSGNAELLFRSDMERTPLDWSRDGRFILFMSRNPQTGNDLWFLPLAGDRKPSPFAVTPFGENAARFSPDGKWVAYFSNESGANQIYVQPFPQTGEKIQVSVDGGGQPKWSHNGKELFFVANNRMMEVDIEAAPRFKAGVPKPLFRVTGYNNAFGGGRYSVTRDGKRFLMSLSSEISESPMTVVMNWTAKLKK